MMIVSMRVEGIGLTRDSPSLDTSTFTPTATRSNFRQGCYNCGETNHQQRNCRIDLQLRCTLCHRLGNKQHQCKYYNYQGVGEEDYAEVNTNECKRDVEIDHVNAQSIIANKDEINLLINERDTDILCVSETWLSPEVHNEHVSIPKYVLYRCDAKREGGVCIYIKDTLRSNLLEVNIVKEQKVCGWLYKAINYLLLSLVACTAILNVYQTHSTILKMFQILLIYVIKEFYLLRDFNDDLLSSKSKFKQIITNAKLSSRISKPT